MSEVIASGGPEKLELSWSEVRGLAQKAVQVFRERNPRMRTVNIYPIPNGGIYAALLLQQYARVQNLYLEIVDTPDKAYCYVDDIIDSGKTMERMEADHGIKQKMVLAMKTEENKDTWVSFPWERANKEDGPQDNVRRILQYIGEDVNREGLRETPARVVKSYGELFAGYKQNPADVMKVFEEGACQEMVLLKDIEFYSCCEHHMQPFFGKAHIAYIPDGKVIGVSKLARILDIYARRLQIQERLCENITGALTEYLEPKGAACVLEAVHFCMVCRGVQKQNSKMVTSSLKGAFLEHAVRQEFFSLIRQ